MFGTLSTFGAEFGWPGGDCPGQLDFWYELPAPITKAIGDALAPFFAPARGPGACYRALCLRDGPVGRYRLSAEKGSWFIRVSSRLGNPGLEKSITDYLFHRGVNVNRLLIAGVTLQWERQTFRIDVRRMTEGRHFNSSTTDLSRLGSTLAVCHQVLLDFPRANEIRAAACARYRRLGNIRDLITEALEHGTVEMFAERASWASLHRDWLAEMVERFDPYLNELPDSQCMGRSTWEMFSFKESMALPCWPILKRARICSCPGHGILPIWYSDSASGIALHHPLLSRDSRLLPLATETPCPRLRR